MVVAANKMDTPEAQANWETITTDPDYDHLSFVPASAHAEKALKNANEAGVVDYTPARATSRSSTTSPASRKRASIRSASSSRSTTAPASRARSKPPSSTCSTVSPSSRLREREQRREGRLPRLFHPPRRVDDRGLRAFHIHSDIGEGLLHGTDCRSGRQVGTDHELSHRDVIELISTKQAAP